MTDGSTNPQVGCQPINRQNLCQILYENEGNWTGRGARRYCPIGSGNVLLQISVPVTVVLVPTLLNPVLSIN